MNTTNNKLNSKYKNQIITPRKLKRMKTTKVLLTGLMLFMLAFAACKKDNRVEPEPEIPTPTMENLELGLGDSGIGVIGEDFHFEGDILAVDKIDTVEVQFVQKPGQTYSKPWKHEIIWTQYKGLKNTNIHKHFNIPKEAAEGKYDLIVIVHDENGSKLEVKRDLEIYTRTNLPIRPIVSGLYMHRNWMPFYDSHSDRDNYPTQRFKKGDTLQVQANISFVKGDGKLYLLLIKKSANYNPKTIEEVDLSKSIVYDVFEHKKEANIYDFSNTIFDFNSYTVVRNMPNLIIGAEKDNNTPEANTISGAKAWQTGDYNLVMIYKNTTANQTLYKSIPLGIDYN
jgi:hypothetical protein